MSTILDIFTLEIITSGSLISSVDSLLITDLSELVQ